ncbi:MAG: hypothetical protein IPK97_13195 [Ahniella sp.]|nr:hypothetical protein [Ahniella sp.]
MFSAAAGAPPLDKATATAILQFQGYKNVAIAAVVNSEGMAQVIGVARFDDKPLYFNLPRPWESDNNARRRPIFLYDASLGWFLYEDQLDKATNSYEIRLWSKTGYSAVQEVRELPVAKIISLGGRPHVKRAGQID